jgi:hypothetical protein
MQFLRESAGVALAWLLCAPGLLLAQSGPGHQAAEPRARDVGIPFDGTPGPLPAMTVLAGCFRIRSCRRAVAPRARSRKGSAS